MNPTSSTRRDFLKKVWKITLVKDNVKILLVFLPEWDWFGLVISVDLVIADVKTTSHSYRTSKGKAINYIKILEGKGWKKVEEK